MYFIQDARSSVGNCGSWWAPKGAGYVCSIDDAGQYTGEYCCSGLRATDVPWPVDYVSHWPCDTYASTTRRSIGETTRQARCKRRDDT